MPRVLISGGSGLIGQALCRRLLDRGYEVAVLGRNIKAVPASVSHHIWNPERQEIDRKILGECDAIIHLAGVNIGAARWTSARKKAIVDSRVESARLILDRLPEDNMRLKAFISASAIGYYGAITSEHIYRETDPPARDFLGQTCDKWEQVADHFAERGIRTVKIRTGIVLSREGGVLARLRIPVKAGFASALGSGRQYMPWIHMYDLCDIYLYALENTSLHGAYNAVAPEFVTNQTFTAKLARAWRRPFWFPNIPAIVMKMIYGEMSLMLLTGSRISCEKIQSAGYQFQYPDLDGAFKQLLDN